MRTYDIFISHPSESIEGAKKLNEKLRSLGFSTFIDSNSLIMESTWDNTIETALKNSRAMVIYCDNFSNLKKPAVSKEWNYFLNNHPKSKVVIVGPKKDARNLPERLRNMQVVDKASPNIEKIIFKRFKNSLVKPTYKYIPQTSLNVFSKLTNRVIVNPKTYIPIVLAFTVLLMIVGIFLLSSFTDMQFLQLFLFCGIMILNASGSIGLMFLNRFKHSNSALLLNIFIGIGFFIASLFISYTNSLYASIGLSLLFSFITLNCSYLFNILYFDKNCDINSPVSIVSSSLLCIGLLRSFFIPLGIFDALKIAPILSMAVYFSFHILLMIFAIKWVEKTYPFIKMSFFSLVMYFISLIFVYLPYSLIDGTNAINYWIALVIFVLSIGHIVYESTILMKNIKYHKSAFRKLIERRR